MRLLLATVVAIATFSPTAFADSLVFEESDRLGADLTPADELEVESQVLGFLGLTAKSRSNVTNTMQNRVAYDDHRHPPMPPPGRGYLPPPPGYGRRPGYPPPHYPPPGYRPGPGYPPPYGLIQYKCYAQNARGIIFRAIDDSPRRAQRQAMNKCYDYPSRYCDPMGCKRDY